MIDNTPEDRRRIAEEVNGRKSKSGKTLYPEWINSTDELIAQYREYAKRELASRYPKDTDPVLLDKLTEMYADLAAKTLSHDMPALVYFFKRFMTQH